MAVEFDTNLNKLCATHITLNSLGDLFSLCLSQTALNDNAIKQ